MLFQVIKECACICLKQNSLVRLKVKMKLQFCYWTLCGSFVHINERLANILYESATQRRRPILFGVATAAVAAAAATTIITSHIWWLQSSNNYTHTNQSHVYACVWMSACLCVKCVRCTRYTYAKAWRRWYWRQIPNHCSIMIYKPYCWCYFLDIALLLSVLLFLFIVQHWLRAVCMNSAYAVHV